MNAPLVIAVDDDPALLAVVERELTNRYATDYRICCLGSTPEALAVLEQATVTDDDVALVLAAEQLGGAPGSRFLGEVGRFFPHAQRALLIGWELVGDIESGDAIFEAIAAAQIDHYVIRPAPPPDEQFHQAISSFLLAWSEARRRAPYTIDVVGESWSGRAYELREVLGRCAMPHRFSLAESEEGRAIIADAGPRRFPLLVLPSGHVMEDPSDAEIGVVDLAAPADGTGDQSCRCPRRRGCPARLGQARGLCRRVGVDRHRVRPPAAQGLTRPPAARRGDRSGGDQTTRRAVLKPGTDHTGTIETGWP